MRFRDTSRHFTSLSRWLVGMGLTCWLLVGIVFLFEATFLTQVALAVPLTQTIQEGQQIFQQKCIGCHRIGGGKLVGPDLQDVTKRRDLAWIKNFISAPEKAIAAGDPIATQLLQENNNLPMPNPGLTPTQVEALVAYLENPAAMNAAPVAPLPPGLASQGALLFTGKQQLDNGGINCIACHNIPGVAALGGGSLGPDLTHVIVRYGGEAGLSSALSTLPFPTMQGPFANQPLTAQEQADLLAYFKQVDQQAPPPRTGIYAGLFVGGGFLGLVVLFGLMAYFWPRQRQSIGESLRSKA